MKKFVTSESVTEGHPDKICDQISDAILDNLLVQDPYSRVAVETLVTTGSVHVAGEVTTRGFADVQSIVRRVLKEIGYTDPKFGIDADDAGFGLVFMDKAQIFLRALMKRKTKNKELETKE